MYGSIDVEESIDVGCRIVTKGGHMAHLSIVECGGFGKGAADQHGKFCGFLIAIHETAPIVGDEVGHPSYTRGYTGHTENLGFTE